MLLTTDAVGGVWRYSMELASGLTLRGVEVVLVVLGPAPDAVQVREAAAIPGLRLIAAGLSLDWLATAPNDLDVIGHALAGLARQFDVDAIQLHTPAFVGALSWPVPVVAVVHSCVGTWWQAVRTGSMPTEFGWRVRAMELGIARADGVVAPSASFASALHQCYCVRRPIKVVLNGRTPRRVTAGRRRQVHALTAGRLWDEGKNVAALDTAAGKLTFPVKAAGSACGPNGGRITYRHLRMLGPLDEPALADAYARAPVFVSVALYEPFGLAVLEAAQAGCALVLSDIPTFRELWDGAADFVPPHDVRRIASAVEYLVRNPDLCAQKGAAVQRRAMSFDSLRMADAMWEIHAKLLADAMTAT